MTSRAGPSRPPTSTGGNPITTAFDTETGGLDWFEPDQQAFLTTWSDQRGNDHLAHQDDPRAMAAFVSDMRSAGVLTAHNLSFDVHQLRATSGIDLLTFGKRLVDTALLARVVLPERRSGEGDARGFGLDELSKTFLPATEQKHDLSALAKQHGIKLKATGGYRALHEVEPEALEDYAKQDTRATVELLPHLAAKVTDKLRPTWELERDLQPHLIRAEARGVAVDQSKVEPLLAAYTEKRDRAYEEAVAVLGPEAIADPSDPDSTDDSDALCEALLAHGVPLTRRVKSCGHSDAGCDCALTTNKFALQEFEADFPIIKALADYRQASKFLATYIGPMLGREVVHPSYWQIGAWTGRMSCSRPNMQNLPVRGEGASELREMFVPRPGYAFIISDFDQIELRLLAYYLNDENFKAKIRRGDDVFAELAALLWGGDASEYRKGTSGAKKRGDAKNGTYAITYGVGAPKLSDMLELPPGPPRGPNDWAVQRGYYKATDPSFPEGRKVINTVKSWLPGYDALMGNRNSRIKKKVRSVGHVNTINGRRQPVSAEKEYVGLSALIQGSAADIMKFAIVNAAEALAPLGGLPLLFVHDECVSEVPIEYAEECLQLQDAAMEAAWDLDPPLSVTGTIAYNSYKEGK